MDQAYVLLGDRAPGKLTYQHPGVFRSVSQEHSSSGVGVKAMDRQPSLQARCP
eukprot:CAMPEP_0197697026 /NCGR_PEP_ID=MMETSP1338-20131121/117418_1 /TAXON_ID=43686 ORGANISM="Pelagodinium beii, Strain RCC1491" /NCGR_SAMPLE_ID=MMETSP1338 /ASSEMBLY_ACC=CAM_ASM_000754 /LENGTH=52 /DNA_ID=CAMNT_0043280223 /DNA_START=429 /DNA_END=583 /DNA_ORIENTATION=-